MTLEQEIQLQTRYAYEDGFSKGAHDKAVETAKSAIAMGLDVDQICKAYRPFC